MRRFPKNQVVRATGICLLSGAVLAQIGCYRRVVGVKNAPGYSGPIYEANVEEGNEDLFTSKTVTPTRSYYLD